MKMKRPLTLLVVTPRRRSVIVVAVVAVVHHHIVVVMTLIQRGRVVMLSIMMAAVPSHGPDEPRCAAGSSPGPVLFEVIFAGLDAVVGEEDDEGDERVEGGVDKEASFSAKDS